MGTAGHYPSIVKGKHQHHGQVSSNGNSRDMSRICSGNIEGYDKASSHLYQCHCNVVSAEIPQSKDSGNCSHPTFYIDLSACRYNSVEIMNLMQRSVGSQV